MLSSTKDHANHKEGSLGSELTFSLTSINALSQSPHEANKPVLPSRCGEEHLVLGWQDNQAFVPFSNPSFWKAKVNNYTHSPFPGDFMPAARKLITKLHSGWMAFCFACAAPAMRICQGCVLVPDIWLAFHSFCRGATVTETPKASKLLSGKFTMEKHMHREIETHTLSPISIVLF